MAQCCDARDGAAFANVLNNVAYVLNNITPRVVPRRRSHSSKRPIERIRLFRRESCTTVSR